METIKYAPVIIPTLNRFDHFKRCLESLEHCTGAEHTDVYVALDYPPSEKYVEGWRKIDIYLAEKEKKNGFNKLIVFRRNHNCGMGKAGSNYSLLREFVEKITDRFISSEDDNEFSPNFLEYMNQALEFYKDDPTVLHVSAYTPPIFKHVTNDSTFFGIDTPAYGLGHWVYKNVAFAYSNEKLANDLRKSLKRTLKLYWTWPAIISMALSMLKKNALYGDVRNSMYNLFYHTYTLQPTVSLSRNWGCDGSGLHSGVMPGRENEEIQTEPTFEFQDIPHGYSPAMLKKLFYVNMPNDMLRRIKMMLVTLILLLQFYYSKK